MIAFLDSSVLIKLYINEIGSQEAREFANSNTDIAVSAIAYTETHSGLARRIRDGSLNRLDSAGLLQDFEADWFSFGKVHLDEMICRKAGKLCLQHPIRSLDAIQLASALVASESQEEPFVFFTADKQLAAAARKEKLRTSF